VDIGVNRGVAGMTTSSGGTSSSPNSLLADGVAELEGEREGEIVGVGEREGALEGEIGGAGADGRL